MIPTIKSNMVFETLNELKRCAKLWRFETYCGVAKLIFEDGRPVAVELVPEEQWKT